MPSVRTLLVLLLPALALVATLAAAGAGSAARTSAPPFGPLRIDSFAGIENLDPSRAYYWFDWQRLDATCATLLTYPDAPYPANVRLVPEIATAMPMISSDGRTYTMQIRNDFAFSPPATGVVTAESMKYTFKRVLHPNMGSPAASLLMNIVGAREYNSGQAQDISGITAQGDTLTIRLIERQGEFATLLALPTLCAMPIGLPMAPLTQAPIPTAGPYYVSEYVPDRRLVAIRNPSYHGTRPHHFDSIEYTIGVQLDQQRLRIESGMSDYGDALLPSDQVPLRDLYGPNSAAAAVGLQQWFSNPGTVFDYIPLNTERPLFANPNMRKAVNFAIDRSALVAIRGATAANTTDQYVPPGVPGFRDEQIYPDHPDLERARELAGWHPGDPLRPAELWATSSATGTALANAVRSQLLEIGLDSHITWFSSGLFTAMGRRGAAFDLGPVGWAEDYYDAWDYIQLMDGTTIQDVQNNNLAYFNDPVFNARMHAAEVLVGEERYAAFGQLDVDLARDAAPMAAYDVRNNREFFSRRIGCQMYHQEYETNLAALCLRPEITVDDVRLGEPASGTTTATFTAHLSSEMENQVTVDFATADGTARAGADYVAASGTLTFSPHQRSKTVNVSVKADRAQESSETFFLNLSNESSGTMVDGQAIGTIEGVAPPPPPVRCRVPRVIGKTLVRAKRIIRRAHCSVGRVRKAHTRRARLVGRVMSQKPRARRVLRRGRRVNLVVGRR